MSAIAVVNGDADMMAIWHVVVEPVAQTARLRGAARNIAVFGGGAGRHWPRCSGRPSRQSGRPDRFWRRGIRQPSRCRESCLALAANVAKPGTVVASVMQNSMNVNCGRVYSARCRQRDSRVTAGERSS